METGIIIKQFKIDYEFLISNYLDKSLWSKQWTLFVYRDHVFTLRLHSILTYSNSIIFDISYNKHSMCELVLYNIDNTSIQILKQQINGAIFRLMESYERELIMSSQGYENIKDSLSIEEDILRDIAEQYLDECGVSNSDIRDAYIDSYVSTNSKIDSKLSEYLNQCKYTVLSEIMLVFTKITNDSPRYNNIMSQISNKKDIQKLEHEVKEIVTNLEDDEYIEDLKDELESV